MRPKLTNVVIYLCSEALSNVFEGSCLVPSALRVCQIRFSFLIRELIVMTNM